ncbi:hypothetical protein AX17_004488 [Amanita inopinata Kibby_2008]|nr:hypothetical protein AX17_004488 [Amanita inopinata Kibby_2008]
MSNGSPTAYLLWAILSVIFLIFLFIHLYSYDKFQCLKWNAGRQPGAFKRLMTYSYLGTVPLLVVFSVAMTAIKYKEGYVVLVDDIIIPRPFFLWDEGNRDWLLPLYFCLSIAWALEIVTHLEELTFWLFLINQGPNQRQWFNSWEFRTWYLGSMLAVIGLPLTTLLAREHIESCQAWIFLVGSSASTSTTLCFFYVLARFPSFIKHVKEEGAEPNVVVRLATFYQLNRIRVLFRFLFTIPLFIAAVDGIEPPYPIVANPFALDLLLMLGGIGCFVSSAITLFIFFPRSIAQEAGYRVQEYSPRNSAKSPSLSAPPPHSRQHHQPVSSPKSDFDTSRYDHTGRGFCSHNLRSLSNIPAPVLGSRSRCFSCSLDSVNSYMSPGYESDAESIGIPSQSKVSHEVTKTHSMPPRAATKSVSDPQTDDTVWDRPMTVMRRHSEGVNLYERYGKVTNVTPLMRTVSFAEHVRQSPPPTPLHPYVMNFTSPIDLVDDEVHSLRRVSPRLPPNP